MRRNTLLLLLLFPFLTGFDGPEAREALDTVFRNLYDPDVLVAVELQIDAGQPDAEGVTFAYGRKNKGGETRTLVYTGDGQRDASRILLFQKPGSQDRCRCISNTHSAGRKTAAAAARPARHRIAADAVTCQGFAPRAGFIDPDVHAGFQRFIRQ